MGLLILDLLFLGLGVALSPWCVIPVIILVSAPHGWPSALAFLGGWLTALLTLGIAGVLGLGTLDYSSGSTAADGTAVIQIVLGLLLLVLGARQWRRRGDATASQPRWMGKVEGMRPFVAFGLGAFLPAYALVLAAVADILQANLAAGGRTVAFLLFVVFASWTIALPVAFSRFAPARSGPVLEAQRTWLMTNNRAILGVLVGVLGVFVALKGIVGLIG